MKTTLTLITIITSLFFSACANNNPAEYSNPGRAANASNAPNPRERLQIDLMRDQFTKTFLNNTDNGSPLMQGSSQRFKDQIKPMDKASEAILALKPVTFRYKKELDPESTPQFGLVAEEVEKINPDLVARDAKGEVYTVRYDAVNAMLLNEFLKEHRKVEKLEAALKAVTERLKEQDAKIDKVNAKVD
jgi:endosialidase-like protein